MLALPIGTLREPPLALDLWKFVFPADAILDVVSCIQAIPVRSGKDFGKFATACSSKVFRRAFQELDPQGTQRVPIRDLRGLLQRLEVRLARTHAQSTE